MARKKSETLAQYRKRRGVGNKWKLNTFEYMARKRANRKKQGLKY